MIYKLSATTSPVMRCGSWTELK